MKKNTFLTMRFWIFAMMAVAVAAAVAAAAIALAVINAQASEDYGEHVPGEVIACLATETYSDVATKVANADDNNAVCAQVNSQIESALVNYDYETLLCSTGDDAVLNSLAGEAAKYSVKNLSSDNNKPAQMRFVKIKFDESAKSMSKMISELESLSVVKFAEPNYIASLQDADSSNQDPDFSNVQYAYDNEKTSAKGYAGMNVEGWNDSSTPNITSDKQAVVAVIDSGVDYNHQDIKPSYDFYGDMSQYSGLGGEYGYNATAEEGYDTDPMDIVSSSIGHGTHCAGSVAAQWNSSGISGGAYDCSILPVRITSDDGSMQSSSIIKAFTYVIKTAQAQSKVNIKAINASWGGAQEMSFLLECVNLAGASGIISVFASGNDSLDCDQNIYSHYDLRNNPYTIIVNCSNCKGNMTSFSNYGVKTTDVFAPGDTIMSTIPSWTEEEKGKASLMISDTRFMTKDTDYKVLDDFESQSNGLQYWEDEACQIPATTAGSSTSKKGYNSAKALSIPTSYSSPEVYITGKYNDISGGTNLTFLYNSDFEAGCTTDYLACEVYDLNTADKTRLKRYNFSPCANTCPFGCMSVPVSSITPDANGNFKLKINFEYELSRNIKKRTNCYIDEVCLATTQRPYCFMSGTSMAAPACAGVTAALACKYPNEDIKKIVARIKGGTNHKDSLKNYCYAGGIVDLTRSSSSNADTDLDPVVTSAEVIASSNISTTVKLRGYFLGDSSSAVTINGVNANTVVPGTDGDLKTLTCTFSAKIAGSVPIVVNKGGKTLTRYYELGSSEDLLERITLPDKNSSEFSDFYSFENVDLAYSNDDYLLFQCHKDSNFTFYTYDLRTLKWSRIDLFSTIINAFKDKGTDVNYVNNICGANNTVYLACYLKDGTSFSFKGFGVYDLSDDSLQASIYRGPALSSVVNTFVEGDLLYFTPGIPSQNLWCHNIATEEYYEVATGLDWGIYPYNYKISDGKYLLVDIANAAFNMYELSLDSESNGVTCQNLNQRAYPNITPGTGQTNAISYAVVDGQLMIMGPASFASGSVNVAADSYLRNIQTKEESAMSGLLSHEMVTNCSSARNSDYVFTYFRDAYGPALAKRYIGSDTPPTPDDNTAELVAAATSDTTPVLVLFGVIAATASILLIRKRAMRKYNL